MILLVDIGNTRTKWRVLDEASHLVSSDYVRNEKLNSAFINESFEKLSLKSVYVSNVGEESLFYLFEGFAKSFGVIIKRFETQSRMLNVRLGYEDVSRLGVDRALAMVGAFNGQGVLVIDAGSAITADILNNDGQHLGGYIIAGLEMTRKLLISKTAKVGVIAEVGFDQPGLSTNECVNNGITIMFKSLISGLIDIAKSKGVSRYLVTGGDAEVFRQWSGDRLVVSDNLVLDGLGRYVCES